MQALDPKRPSSVRVRLDFLQKSSKRVQTGEPLLQHPNHSSQLHRMRVAEVEDIAIHLVRDASDHTFGGVPNESVLQRTGAIPYTGIGCPPSVISVSEQCSRRGGAARGAWHPRAVLGRPRC